MNSPCIDILTLARYFGRKLSDKQTDDVEYHLSLCNDCRKEFVRAFLLLKEDTAEEKPTLADNALSLMSRFYEWITLSSCELASVGVRSEEKTSVTQILFVKEIGDLTVRLFIEKSRADKISLDVRIFEKEIPVRNVRITLIREGGGVVSRLLKEGHEILENLSFGTYQMKMIQHSQEKGVLSFEINETGLSEQS